jgi:hypothetical protein
MPENLKRNLVILKWYNYHLEAEVLLFKML